MTMVRFEAGEFLIEAQLLAEAFGLSEEKILALMRDGAITSRCEAGTDKDAGRWRLTFRFGNRACRIVIDQTGNVLRKVSFPVREQSSF